MSATEVQKPEPLSTYFPTAIRQAIADLRAVSHDDRYVIEMGVWHLPDGSMLGRCSVCLAGSVMAKRLGAIYTDDFLPSTYTNNGDQRNILLALAHIASGELRLALKSAGWDLPIGCGIDLPSATPYPFNADAHIINGDRPVFEAWCDEVLKVADWLDEHWAEIEAVNGKGK